MTRAADGLQAPPRILGMTLQILTRLRQSPATNRQLAAMFRDGAAWRTRVSDLRRILPFHTGETVRSMPGPDGQCLYWLDAVWDDAGTAAMGDTLALAGVVPRRKGSPSSQANTSVSPTTTVPGRGRRKSSASRRAAIRVPTMLELRGRSRRKSKALGGHATGVTQRRRAAQSKHSKVDL